MGKQTNIIVSEALLVKYLTGEAGPEEAKAIDDWAGLSPDNDRLLHQYLRLWSEARPQGAYLPPDLRREWERLQQGINSAPVRRINWVQWVAAALLLVTLGGGLLFFLKPQKTADVPPMLAITATKGILHDTLKDKSLVVLSTGSRLERPASFAADGRQVQLQGEAYFSVVPDAQRSFTVHTALINIKVLGTAFNVSTGTDSALVQVENGTVLAYNSNDSVVVKSGMQAVYHVSTRRFTLSQIENNNNYAYATRVFRFQETPLATVAHVLEKAYNVKIILENEKLAGCTISTAFTDMPLEYVLEVITASLAIQYRMEGGVIYLQGNECN